MVKQGSRSLRPDPTGPRETRRAFWLAEQAKVRPGQRRPIAGVDLERQIDGMIWQRSSQFLHRLQVILSGKDRRMDASARHRE